MATKLRRIVAALDRNQADGAGHARLGNANNRGRGVVGAKPERLADVGRDRLPRRLDVERFQLAAERAVRVDAAQHHLGIRQRRPGIAGP